MLGRGSTLVVIRTPSTGECELYGRVSNPSTGGFQDAGASDEVVSADGCGTGASKIVLAVDAPACAPFGLVGCSGDDLEGTHGRRLV